MTTKADLVEELKKVKVARWGRTEKLCLFGFLAAAIGNLVLNLVTL